MSICHNPCSPNWRSSSSSCFTTVFHSLFHTSPFFETLLFSLHSRLCGDAPWERSSMSSSSSQEFRTNWGTHTFKLANFNSSIMKPIQESGKLVRQTHRWVRARLQLDALFIAKLGISIADVLNGRGPENLFSREVVHREKLAVTCMIPHDPCGDDFKSIENRYGMMISSLSFLELVTLVKHSTLSAYTGGD
jgi:hypothetical protein